MVTFAVMIVSIVNGLVVGTVFGRPIDEWRNTGTLWGSIIAGLSAGIMCATLLALM